MKTEVNLILSKYFTKPLSIEEKLKKFDNTTDILLKQQLLQQYPEIQPILKQREKNTKQEELKRQQRIPNHLQMINQFPTNIFQQKKIPQQQQRLPSIQQMSTQKPIDSFSVFREPTQEVILQPDYSKHELGKQDKLQNFIMATYEEKEIFLEETFFQQYLGPKKIEYRNLNELQQEEFLKNDPVFASYVQFYDECFLRTEPSYHKIFQSIIEGIEKLNIIQIKASMEAIPDVYLFAISMESLHSISIIHLAVNTMNSEVLECVFASLKSKNPKLLMSLTGKRNFVGHTPLIECILNNWVDGIRICLNYGCSIYKKELKFNYNAIHAAIHAEDIIMLNLILVSGQIQKETSIDSDVLYSLIEFAIIMGRTLAVKALYAHQPESFIQSPKIFFLASRVGTIGMFQTLLSVSPHTVDNEGFSAAHIAAMTTTKMSLKFIKEVHARYPQKLNDLSKNNFTPLMFAMKYQKPEFIAFLLEKGANIFMKERKNGTNALMILMLSNKPNEIRTILTTIKSHLTKEIFLLEDNNGLTALHIAKSLDESLYQEIHESFIKP
eukprot:gene12765-7039_t